MLEIGVKQLYRKSVFIVLSFIAMIAIILMAIFYMNLKKSNGIAVLMYHDFGYRGIPSVINEEVFADQMNSLARHGFNVISMKQYVDYMEGEIELPKKSVLITFDDGYEDFYEIAYPILKQHHFPATNFIVVKSTDEPNPEYFPHLTWDQMREMKANGMSFYSHTYDSHIKINEIEDKYPLLANYLEGETSEEYKARVRADLEQAHLLLVKELGEQANILAFPYGAHSEELLEVMDEIGIEHAFKIRPGINERGGDGLYYRINAGLSSLDGEALVKLIKENY